MILEKRRKKKCYKHKIFNENARLLKYSYKTLHIHIYPFKKHCLTDIIGKKKREKINLQKKKNLYIGYKMY